MRFSLIQCGLGAALVVATSAGATETKAAEVAAPQVDLSGNWKLNKGSSDDAREKFREAMGGDRRGPGGGGGMGGRGGGMDRGGMGQAGGGIEPGGGPRRGGGMRELFEAADEIEILQDGSKEIVFLGGEHERMVATDGKTATLDDQREVTATWEGSQLVIETLRPEAGKHRETYELSPDSKRLSVKLEIESKRAAKTVVIMRIYDRKEKGEERAKDGTKE